MLEEISGILGGVGYAGGIIGVFAAIFTAISKFQPFTFLTATLPERVFLSKEKRATKKFIDFIFEAIGISLYFSLILFYSYSAEYKYFIWISFTMFIAILVGAILVLSLATSVKMSKFIRKKIKEANKIKKFLFLLVYLIIFFSYITLIPYLWGSFSATIMDVEPKNQNLWSLIVTLYLYIIIISSILIAGLRLVTKILVSKKYGISEKVLYILEKGTLKQWFLYHPIDRMNILAGDSPNPYNSTVYKFIEKSILLTEKVYVYNEEEESTV